MKVYACSFSGPDFYQPATSGVYLSLALISSAVKYVDHGLRVLFLYVTLVLQPSILHRWKLNLLVTLC